ncbi:MAG: gliding motility-associated ABC transporter permease subunit GldF [Bacteroidales bacterium]|nr:gliding motility-associated ABC transporter permease subunit GldF [Bacteroidales bacterium]
MRALFIKEITGFFSSLTGYIVIVVFIVVNGLFLWVFPGNLNIPDSGIASLSPLFETAPWVFLFLIPAITMRSLAEEKKAGTFDLLLTRPVSNLQILLAKYFSAVVLALLALLPTLVYYLTLVLIGSPAGNIDQGATWGSYTGLVFLAAVYGSVGIFSSTLTDNIIVSFLVSVLLCFMVFTGFNYIGSLFPLGSLGSFFISLGIDEHYKSVSRGVIDSRDIVYFFSVIAVFLVLSNLKLNSKRW